MQKSDAAAFLAGVSQVEGSQAANPTNLHVISGEVGARSEDGKATVAIDGLVFGEADDQYVEMDTLGGLEEGDVATVILTGESGHAMTPLAIGAVGSVDSIRDKAEAAEAVAQEAQEVAEATGQHFWPADDGIHVTEITEEEWNDQEDETTYHQGRNILINSYGFLLRIAESWLSQFTSGVVAFYDGLGNAASNIFARFGRDGAQIGYSDKSHMELDYHSMSMVDKDNSTYFDVRDLRDQDGRIAASQTHEGDGTTTAFSSDYPLSLIHSVTIDGVETTDYTYSGDPDEGEYWFTFTTAPADGSVVAFNRLVDADSTYKSFAMGDGAVAEGRHSYALGRGASVTSNTDVSDQMVLGRYNRDSGYDYYIDEHAIIVGNGTDDTHRSDAMSVDWNGRAQFHGDYVRIAHMVSGQSAMFSAERPDTERVIRFGIGAGGENRGIWDAYLTGRGDVDPFFPGDPDATRDGDWLFWADSNNYIHIQGWEPSVLTQQTSGNVSVPKETDRSIVQIQINEPGCWILIGHAVFSTNTTGRRVMGITTSANASLGTGASSPIITQAPVSGGATAMTVIDVVSVGWTGSLTRYLTVYQNSGGALNCQGSIKAVRVMMPA